MDIRSEILFYGEVSAELYNIISDCINDSICVYSKEHFEYGCGHSNDFTNFTH